jgi:hypothetical protein
MGKIHLPPGTGGGKIKEVIPVCVSSSGGDTLEITITEPGYCLHGPDGYFKPPDLPSGPVTGSVSAPQIYSFSPAVSAGIVCLVYLETESKNLYLFIITIQHGKCPPDGGDS